MGGQHSQFTEEELKDYQVKVPSIYSIRFLIFSLILLGFVVGKKRKHSLIWMCLHAAGTDVLYSKGNLTVSFCLALHDLREINSSIWYFFINSRVRMFYD